MTDYLLRDIDETLWKRVQARAAKDGHTLRWIILKLLTHYAAHGLPE